MAVQRGRTGTVAAVSALGLTAALAGCGLTGDSGDVTLKLVAADYGDSSANSSQKYWDSLAKEYEAKHEGVRVDVSVYSWSDVDRKVKELVEAGDAPDMAQIGAYADYADAGQLYKADDLVSIPVQADWISQLSNAGEVKGVQYGMPFAASTRLLFYNKTLFTQAGLTPPTTWDELAQDAQALKSEGVKYPYALPLGPEEAQAETMQWLLGGGGGYTDTLGTYSIDSTENTDTFTWLRDNLVAKKLTGPVAPGKLDRADAFAAFAKGQVGMLNGHPSLMGMAEDKGVKFGMVPMPGENGQNKISMGVADWMTAFKQNGHAEQIGDFLDFVYSEKNVLAFSRKYDLLPVTESASEVMSTDKRDADLKPFLDELPLSETYPVGETSWAQVSAAVKKRIGAAVTPTGNPAAVLSQLQATATSAQNTP
ncbi:ABC transporter substrate-binding protein [Streptomyces resistomycificus]|uniref:ABC transporter substrate-binding protein n=1 Tax=Streptomyces resistomycificus TaxID=67356 RepID=A0A0L8L768_9ACTN|nr:extracellular solute-binding protein [Streptomyces resistomycificus]KOG33965.1 ABC transporter substrate-binding protein [Streptomyces resistomycificus]KUN96469.1 ABC transporter substrate-binding protein [Streptomyces resistomycificus]